MTVHPLFDADHAAAAPHGLLGQAYDGDGIGVIGATDDYRGEEITTSAMGEGAIEGVHTDYKMVRPGHAPLLPAATPCPCWDGRSCVWELRQFHTLRTFVHISCTCMSGHALALALALAMQMACAITAIRHYVRPFRSPRRLLPTSFTLDMGKQKRCRAMHPS